MQKVKPEKATLYAQSKDDFTHLKKINFTGLKPFAGGSPGQTGKEKRLQKTVGNLQIPQNILEL
ncbi:MAG: hypothetical protein K1Y36_01635 [Blastocatellia bacterium]|nr:hypothetical protein [Blastocatellia bacterium]